MTGQTISKYRVGEKLGEGGMGAVYRAEDTKLKRAVALKFLSDRERFLREAQAVAALNHTNICTIYEVDEAHGFIAMELLEGKTVKDKIAERPLPLKDAIDIALQVCAGLQHAHEKRIIHRDIKPANLMVSNTGTVKIMDFGLAQLGDSTRITKTGTSMGTPAYMSPEQVGSGVVDGRTDLWSLGVVLYEALTQQLPFPGETEQALAYSIVHASHEPVTARRGGLPLALDQIFNKLFAKKAEDRFQNAADLAVDLRAASEAPVARLARRARWPFAVAAALFLIAASYSGWRAVAPSKAPQSIAILPLRPLTQEGADSLLGLGIADALITKLGQTGRLRVRPTGAVKRFAKGDVDPLEAARQLNTEAVLDGNLQQSGSRLRVSVHLLRTSDGESMWTQSFEFNAGDVFSVQDEIARQVAEQLRLRLNPEEKNRLDHRYTASPEAFQYYSKAIFHLDNRFRMDELTLAIDLLRKAIEADPAYALARAQLGYAYAWRAAFFELDPELVRLARSELEQAEKLDRRLAQVHVARSFLYWSQYENWNVRAAILEMRKAEKIDLNAGNVELGAYYFHIGLEGLAEKHARAAIATDPRDDAAKSELANQFYLTMRVDEGLRLDKELFNRGPRVDYYLAKELLTEAAPLVESAYAIGQFNLGPRINKAHLLVLQRNPSGARKEIAAAEAELDRQPKLRPYHHRTYGAARVRARLGDAPQALRWLKLTVDTGLVSFPMFERDRMLDPVRNDPEVAKLLATVKSTWEGYKREFGE